MLEFLFLNAKWRYFEQVRWSNSGATTLSAKLWHVTRDRGRLRDGGVCGGGPRGEDLRPRAAQRRAGHEAAGRVRRGLEEYFQREISWNHNIYNAANGNGFSCLDPHFMQNISNQTFNFPTNLESTREISQLCNIILKVSFYIPPDRDLWYCFTKFLYLRKKSVMNSNA